MIKRILILFLAAMISTIAYGGDVKVKAVMTSGPDEEASTSFAADTPKVFALFKTNGAEEGDKIRAVWIAEDVGDAAPANSKIDEKTLTLQGDTDDGDFSLKKPTKGWPAGKYRVDIYVNDEVATTIKFAIQGNVKREQEAKESSAIPDEAQLKSMTENAIVSFGEGVKEENFSQFYTAIADAWQKQTSPEKLAAAFKDFFDKEIDLPAAIKEIEPIFNQPATINSEGVLVTKGYYPTTPNRVVFQLKYLQEEDDWKLAGIDVKLKE
jgi:hypothetical protein